MKLLPCGIPMVWHERTVTEMTAASLCRSSTPKNRNNISYPNLPSTVRLVAHGPDLPVPATPKTVDSVQLSELESNESTRITYEPETVCSPQQLTQSELNDLVGD